MRKLFKLKTPEGGVSPSTGEDAGRTLKMAADLFCESKELAGVNMSAYGVHAAQLYSLAADAYETGAAFSLGHNRSERYHAQARLCRAQVERMTEAADA